MKGKFCAVVLYTRCLHARTTHRTLVRTKNNNQNYSKRGEQVYLRNSMPFFSSKFSPKKKPVRKQNAKNRPDVKIDDLIGEGGTVKLKLENVELLFNDGEWSPESLTVGNNYKDSQRFKKVIQKLEEENNTLKLKSEVLLDMLTEATCEFRLQETEINKLSQELAYKGIKIHQS